MARVCFIEGEKRGTFRFFLEGDQVESVRVALQKLQAYFRKEGRNFKRCENASYVNLDKAHLISRAGQGRYWIHFENTKAKALVSSYFSEGIAKSLGVKTLDHISPESNYGKERRDLGLVAAWEKELDLLNPEDKQAVDEFMKRWDIRKFDNSRMKKWFSYETTEDVDQGKLLKNLIWQQWRLIRAGISDQVRGNIRTFWYENRIGSILQKAGYPKSEADILYGYFEKFIRLRMITYSGFGFRDNLEPLRWVGEKFPQLMVFAEKQGQMALVSDLGEETGCTWMATEGQVPYITIEYFSRELRKSLPEGQTFHIFTFVDFNPDGHDIARNLKEKLDFYGVKQVEIHPLVTLDILSDEQIREARKELVRIREYQTEDGSLKRVPFRKEDRTRFKDVTDWFFGSDLWPGINSEKLLERKPHPKDGEIVTIYGVDFDVIGYTRLKERFYEVAERFFEPPPLAYRAAPSLEDTLREVIWNAQGKPCQVKIDGVEYMIWEKNQYLKMMGIDDE